MPRHSDLPNYTDPIPSPSPILSDMADQPDPEAPFNIIIQPDQMAGVWANFAQVSHSPYEFTLDFVRLDFNRHEGIVVARISMSPLFIDQLIEALRTNWDLFAQ